MSHVRRVGLLILFGFVFLALSAERYFPTAGGGIDERGFLNNGLSVPTGPTATPTITPTPTVTPTPTSAYSSPDPRYYYHGGTLQFWVDGGDPTYILDASDVSVTNGTAIKTIKDKQDGSTLWTQIANTARRPTYDTSKGTRGAVSMASGKEMVTSRTNMLNGASKVSYALVFYPSSVNTDVITYEDFWGGLPSRFIPFVNGGTHGTLYTEGARLSTGPDVNDGGTSQVITGSKINVAIWQWDVSAGTTTIYLNNASTSVAGHSFSTAGSIQNTNAGNVQFGNQGDGVEWIFEAHLMTGDFMDSTQRSTFFADMKTRHGNTPY